jgi:hypothetical protein
VSFTSLTDADRAAMLAAIGIESIDELFGRAPAVRLGSRWTSAQRWRGGPSRDSRAGRRNVDVGAAVLPPGGMYDATCGRGGHDDGVVLAARPASGDDQGVLQAIFSTRRSPSDRQDD